MKRTTLVALLLLVIVCAAILKADERTGSSDKVAADKWEYLAVAGPSSTNFSPTNEPSMRKETGSFGREGFVLEQHLDKLGAKGWELVSVAGLPNTPPQTLRFPNPADCGTIRATRVRLNVSPQRDPKGCA